MAIPARGIVWMLRRVHFIDSHTAGEPTRTIVAGLPDLGTQCVADRRRRLVQQQDAFRHLVLAEPRGSEILVGALLIDDLPDTQDTGVVFFNNVGPLHMCGHGTIGVAVTLAYLGRIDSGRHTIQTSVGPVQFELSDDLHTVRLQNVPSYRLAHDVAVTLDDGQTILGDVAWGGNWFFLTEHNDHPLTMPNVDALTIHCQQIKAALQRQGISGDQGREIDHIELFQSVGTSAGRNFVLCPGGQFDRSPCGTGTSAKVACLAADGQLKPGQKWRQQSVTGTWFEASYEAADHGQVIPTIQGDAWITADGTLLFDTDDPLAADARW
ncbi:proline racemase family protein [Crateriforma spongiae]|uniref:proline racemase family protein n=1 Tax=Crateriforma spongiae TaxID=2724528 RepID=UPI0039AEB5FD